MAEPSRKRRRVERAKSIAREKASAAYAIAKDKGSQAASAGYKYATTTPKLNRGSIEEEEYERRSRVAVVATVGLLVIGLLYFGGKAIANLINPETSALDNPLEKQYITRNCYETEYKCSNDCGRAYKDSNGKFCCLRPC